MRVRRAYKSSTAGSQPTAYDPSRCLDGIGRKNMLRQTQDETGELLFVATLMDPSK
jgi:hypothetical protein